MSWGRVQDVLGKLDGFLSKKNIDAGGVGWVKEQFDTLIYLCRTVTVRGFLQSPVTVYRVKSLVKYHQSLSAHTQR